MTSSACTYPPKPTNPMAQEHEDWITQKRTYLDHIQGAIEVLRPLAGSPDQPTMFLLQYPHSDALEGLYPEHLIGKATVYRDILQQQLDEIVHCAEQIEWDDKTPVSGPPEYLIRYGVMLTWIAHSAPAYDAVREQMYGVEILRKGSIWVDLDAYPTSRSMIQDTLWSDLKEAC